MRKSEPTDFDLRLSRFPLTDLGNAERFLARNEGRFLWCFELGWMWWDERRWNFDDADAKVLAAVHATVRAIQGEAAALEGSEFDIQITASTRGKEGVWLHEKVAQWGRSSENRPRLNAIAEQVRVKMSVRPDELDADPMRMTVLNGTLLFRRPDQAPEGGDLIQLRPHDPRDRITKLAPVLFDPEATCPTFDAFFPDVQPDAAQRRFLQQWFGYNCSGLTTEQKLVFLFGGGRNGKSTLVDLVGRLLGSYADTVPIETFLDQGAKRKGSDASPDIAGLKAVRCLRTSEPEKGAKLAEALIKLLTGGEPIKVRFLNKEFFTLRPAFKLTLSGNHRPDIAGADEGIWRRVVLVPFLVQIAKSDVDPLLPDKLMLEASGVLNWLLDGLRDWLENGLVIPDPIAAATQAYREDSDPCGRFLSLCTEEVSGERVQSSVLHGVFLAWAKWAGEREWTQTGFARALKDRGYRTKQSNVIWWLGLKLTKDITDFSAERGTGPPDDRPFADRDGGE